MRTRCCLTVLLTERWQPPTCADVSTVDLNEQTVNLGSLCNIETVGDDVLAGCDSLQRLCKVGSLLDRIWLLRS